MAKKNEPDKLAQEASQAIAAGMSYGRWKAMQQAVPIEKKPPADYYIRRICENCGNEFIRGDNHKRKYCCDRCRIAANNKRRYEKARLAEVQNDDNCTAYDFVLAVAGVAETPPEKGK